MYKVYAYTGLAWLRDCGTFDEFHEAQECLEKQHEDFMQGIESDDASNEAFWFDSRIEEISQSENEKQQNIETDLWYVELDKKEALRFQI